MTQNWRWLGLGVLLAALVSGAIQLGTAGDNPKGKGKPKPTEMDTLDKLVLAAKLEEYARETESPRALLAAAELYWSIDPKSMTELKDVKVTTEDIPGVKEKGEPAGKPTKVQTTHELAEELMNLAVEKSKPNEKAGVEILAKEIKLTYGSAKGPHTVVRTVGGNKQQTVTINFQGGQVAKLGFRANEAPLHVSVNGPNIHVHDFCRNAGATWIPSKAGPVEIHLKNTNNKAVTYTLIVN